VAFTAPASDGGSPITGYTVTATDATTPGNGGQTATGMSSPIVVAGLTNGDAYTFTVTAVNAAGTGAASAVSAAVTPKRVIVPIVVVPGPVVVAGAPVGLAATGSDATLPLGLAGLLLVAGLVSLRVARLRRRSRTQHIG
jgi:hypothetical protein